MSEEKYGDIELRTEAVRFALGNCTDDEYYETSGELVEAAQDIFEYLKDGTIPKKEVKESGY